MSHTPPSWLVLPFVLLLGMIATGPVLYPYFWHRHYGKVSLLLASIVITYYTGKIGDFHMPIEAIVEYGQFIALITASYVASSTIAIHLQVASTPWMNLVVLWIGALLANFIGTTGASMLLIKPYMRLNKGRLQAYHVIFFIFMVSNVGGALTPIGDPPLFLGYLRGVPFFWVATHLFFPWLCALTVLSVLFYLFDRRTLAKSVTRKGNEKGPLVVVKGAWGIVWLLLIVGAVFVDPSLAWVPGICYHGHNLSYVRECLLLVIALGAYCSADKAVLRENGFSWEPLQEVVLLFVGIFVTMKPALALIEVFARSDAGKAIIDPSTLYVGTGVLSSFLDNAPTYLSFLAAGMSSQGLNVGMVSDVVRYSETCSSLLRATSMGAVFFGAMTYVGNGPNFMVKAIAEREGVEMPSFGGYLMRFALPILLPVLALVWLIFVRGQS